MRGQTVTEAFPLDEAVIYQALDATPSEDPGRTRELLAKAREMKGLENRDLPTLMAIQDHEVVRDLAEMGFIPSYCTSCYRMGLTGADFMDMAKPGEIKAHCNPNALSTLQEYLEDHASPLTRCSAEQMMASSFTELDAPARATAEHMVERVKRGERDVFC